MDTFITVLGDYIGIELYRQLVSSYISANYLMQVDLS